MSFLGISLGIVLGAAIGTSPDAVAEPADPIGDAWPYGDANTTFLSPPGFFDTGSLVNTGEWNFGPIANTEYDVTYLDSVDGNDWYSVHGNTFVIPSFVTDDHEVVDTLFDTSATFPTVGTVYDGFELFPIHWPIGGTIPIFEHDYLYDPEFGFASVTMFRPVLLLGIANSFLWDTAGIKDVVSFFGGSFTLLDIPFTAPDAGAVAADLGDGFGQLLTELGSDLAALF